jgi:hypothetical protein
VRRPEPFVPGDLRFLSLFAGVALALLLACLLSHLVSALKGLPMLSFLDGKKTYALVAGALLVIVGQFVQGQVDLATAVQHGLEALSIATLRAGVAKAQQ